MNSLAHPRTGHVAAFMLLLLVGHLALMATPWHHGRAAHQPAVVATERASQAVHHDEMPTRTASPGSAVGAALHWVADCAVEAARLVEWWWLSSLIAGLACAVFSFVVARQWAPMTLADPPWGADAQAHLQVFRL
jgi:hypothetical protein